MKIFKGIVSAIIGFGLIAIAPHYLANRSVISLGTQIITVIVYPIGVAMIWFMWRRK